MESINTINKTLLGAALAVFVLVTALPQESALARGGRGGGMDVRTADLCRTGNEAVDESGGIGTVAAVTDKRNGITAWAVSLEGMQIDGAYDVYDIGSEPAAYDCEDDNSGTSFVYTIDTDEIGEAFRNTVGDDGTYIPEVGDVIQICRGFMPILEGVLVKGGKERNKPNRCN